jgi:hypothetical protein
MNNFTQESESPLNEGQTSHSKSKMILPIVIGILIILIIVSVGVIFWQQQEISATKKQTQIFPINNSPAPIIVTYPTPIPSTKSSYLSDYVNEKEGFSFSYPRTWIIEQGVADGIIVTLADRAGRLAISGGLGDYDFTVTKCTSINTECATDGEWIGKRQYKNIADFFTDKMSAKQPSQTKPTVTVGGLTGYGVIRGGAGNNYEIMIEHNGEIFLLDFSSSEGDKLTPEYNQIISSFKFL